MITNDLETFLQQRKEQHLYRCRQINSHDQLIFCSNDYLGLASQNYQLNQQIGSTAAHLICGHHNIHHDLELALAKFTGYEKTLLFSTGYMANVGVLSALMGRDDAVFLDKWCHASLVDGAILSRAKLFRYPHNNLQVLEKQLKKSTSKRKLIVSDGVFSMDGDLAKLPQLVDLSKKYHAWLMIDDAHGLGVLGKNGRGTLEFYQQHQQDIHILIGTLGKAVGTFGAFVAGSETLIEYLIQTARSYIYTTALPPIIAQATLYNLETVQKEPWRREKLFKNISYFKEKTQHLTFMLSDTPIQPLLCKSNEDAINAYHYLKQKNIWVSAIRPPTVPTPRLRITLTTNHSIEQLDLLIEQLNSYFKNQPQSREDNVNQN